MRWSPWVLLACACSAPWRAPALLVDEATARAQLGEPVEVRGTAQDAKLGAAVQSGALVVYCGGLSAWPAGVSGNPVVAHGTLEQRRDLTARTGKAGEVSAGTSGPVWRLRGCRFDPAR